MAVNLSRPLPQPTRDTTAADGKPATPKTAPAEEKKQPQK